MQDLIWQKPTQPSASRDVHKRADTRVHDHPACSGKALHRSRRRRLAAVSERVGAAAGSQLRCCITTMTYFINPLGNIPTVSSIHTTAERREEK